MVRNRRNDFTIGAVKGHPIFQGTHRKSARRTVYRSVVTARGFSFEKHSIVFNKLFLNRSVAKLSAKLCRFFFACAQGCFQVGIFFFNLADFILKQKKTLSEDSG